LFTDHEPDLSAWPGIRAVNIGPITSTQAYSDFMLKNLGLHIQTSHVLVTQWDSWVLNASAWTDEFLQCDYIGAPWPLGHEGITRDTSVGNGGFSLRSQRLQQALLAPEMSLHHPEDLSICTSNRKRLEHDHGIRFADPALALRFAFERTQSLAGASFGFHAFFNYAKALKRAELLEELRLMPPELLRGVESRDLLVDLLRLNWSDCAKELMHKRWQAKPINMRTWRMATRCFLHRLRHLTD
ncbi:MAG: DUF5672 family protein, partial [Pseudomonadota bacterium]